MPMRKDDEKLDRTVEDSFPASDPPANSGIVGPRAARPPRRPHEPDAGSRPKGTPTHKRHATETDRQGEHENQQPK